MLVNNAGLGGQTPVVAMTDDEWDRVLDVTLTSVFRATRAALRYFRDAGHGGVIVNNASVLNAQTDLLEAATAVQSYVWYTDKSLRRKTTITEEDWHESRPLVERAVVGAQRLRTRARTMPTDELRDAYIAVERLIMKVVKGSDDETAPDPWHADV